MGKQSYAADFMPYGEKQHHSRFEMEDRVLSYEPYIPEATKYIKRVDIFVDAKDLKDNEEIKKTIQLILYISKNKGFSVNVYDNLNDFNYMSENICNSLFDGDPWDNQTETIPYNYKLNPAYKLGEKQRETTKIIDVLQELMNVYTLSGCYYKPEKYLGSIRQILGKFGLSEYTEELIKSIRKKSWPNSPEESCNLLSGTINAPIRKFNTEISDANVANKVMSLGAWILKMNNASSFNELKIKIEN